MKNLMLWYVILVVMLFGILYYKDHRPIIIPEGLGDCRYYLTGRQLQECIDMYNGDKAYNERVLSTSGNKVFNSEKLINE